MAKCNAGKAFELTLELSEVSAVVFKRGSNTLNSVDKNGQRFIFTNYNLAIYKSMNQHACLVYLKLRNMDYVTLLVNFKT